MKGTLVLGVELVEALGVDEAHGVLLGQQVSLTVPQLLVGHQGVVAVAHSHVGLQVGQLLSHLCLLSLQELWERERESTANVAFRQRVYFALCLKFQF